MPKTNLFTPTLNPFPLSQEPHLWTISWSVIFNLFLLLASFCQYLNLLQYFTTLKEKNMYDPTLTGVHSPPFLSPPFLSSRKGCLQVQTCLPHLSLMLHPSNLILLHPRSSRGLQSTTLFPNPITAPSVPSYSFF